MRNFLSKYSVFCKELFVNTVFFRRNYVFTTMGASPMQHRAVNGAFCSRISSPTWRSGSSGRAKYTYVRKSNIRHRNGLTFSGSMRTLLKMCVLVTLIVVLQDETTPKQVFRRTIVETFEDQLSSSCEIVGSDILDDSSVQGMSPQKAVSGVSTYACWAMATKPLVRLAMLVVNFYSVPSFSARTNKKKKKVKPDFSSEESQDQGVVRHGKGGQDMLERQKHIMDGSEGSHSKKTSMGIFQQRQSVSIYKSKVFVLLDPGSGEITQHTAGANLPLQPRRMAAMVWWCRLGQEVAYIFSIEDCTTPEEVIKAVKCWEYFSDAPIFTFLGNSLPVEPEIDYPDFSLIKTMQVRMEEMQR